VANLSSLLLPPDPDFVARAEPVAASSVLDRQPGRGIPAATNEGALALLATGAPLNDKASFETRVQTSGGIGAGATWVWRYKGENDDGWRGSDDARFMHSISDPFGGLRFGWGASAVYVSALRREIVYVGEGSSTNQIRAAYRPVDRVQAAWTTTTISFPRGLDNAGDQVCGFDVVELPDGALRALVRNGSDLDLYGSNDGLSWTLIGNDLLSRFAGRRSSTLLVVKLAESGGYLRLAAVDNDVGGLGLGYTITTMVSSDRGATWTETNLASSAEVIDANSSTSWPSGAQRFVLDLVGLGDGGGSFLLAVKASSLVRVYSASGTEGWTLTPTASSTSSGALTLSLGAATTIYRVFLARGPDYVHLLVFSESLSATGVQVSHRKLDRRSSLASGSWEPLSFAESRIDGYNGALRYLPLRAKLHHVGHSLVLVGGVYDLDGGAEEQGVTYWRQEGWSLRPLRDAHPPGVYSAFAVETFALQPTGPLFNAIEWVTTTGRPGGVTWASSTSPWTLTYSGGVTANWNTDRLRITDAGSGVRSHFYEYVDPSTASGSLPDVSWCLGESSVDGPDGSLVEWTARVQGGDRTVSGGARVRVASLPRSGSTSGRAVNVEVRIDENGVSVFDGGAGTTLASIVPDAGVYGSTPIGSAFWEFRLAFQPEPPSTVCACVLSIRRVDREEWLSTARLLPSTSASSITRQQVQFGVPTTSNATTSTSFWRDLRIKQGNALGQVDLAGVYPVPGRIRPDTVRGRNVSTFAVYGAEGVDLAWGGGGGFDGDRHASTLAQQFGIRNLLVSSPRFEWRSARQASPSVALPISSLDFGTSRGAANRFRHDAIGIFGTNAETVEVRYSNDPAFGTSTLAGTLSLTRFAGLRVDAVDGNAITVSGPLPADAEVGSALGRSFYARVTSEAPAGYSDAREWVVEQHRGSTLLLRSATALTTALVGATLAIRSDRGVLLYDAAQAGGYLRLRVANGYPAEGYQRLGTPIPSVRLPLPAPLAWEHEDASAPTVTTFRSRGAVSWAYTEGPSTRSLSLAIDGEASRQRQRIRDVLRTTAGYEEFAGVLVLDDANLRDAESVLLGRISGGVDLSNPGWRLDGGVWRPVGSLKLRFNEEV
jgi:hypothetical protein